MKTKTVYSKKITSEEGREGYVLILKNMLPFFPSTGRSFRIVRDGRARRVKVESYPCTCRGPSEPHRHFFVKSQGLKAGDQVVFRREGGREARYMMLIHRKHSL